MCLVYGEWSCFLSSWLFRPLARALVLVCWSSFLLRLGARLLYDALTLVRSRLPIH